MDKCDEHIGEFMHITLMAPHNWRTLPQDAVARGCRMLFLPENVSFLGTSFTEVCILPAAWK